MKSHEIAEIVHCGGQESSGRNRLGWNVGEFEAIEVIKSNQAGRCPADSSVWFSARGQFVDFESLDFHPKHRRC